MKLTLLDLTQNILSSLSSDEVNSINDTTESRQVVEIIRTVYFNMIARAKLPEHLQLFQLTASGDPDFPTLMYRPDNVSKIDWIKYDIHTTSEPDLSYAYVTILPLQQFLDMTNQFDPDDSDVESFILDDITYYYTNDDRPNFCAVVKDYQIVFDSYDATVDGTLQESKTMCYGQIVPTFTLADSFTPDLDNQQFPLLLNEAKSLAFFELKQAPHEKAEQEARRQWRHLQKEKELVKPNGFNALPKYGRL